MTLSLAATKRVVGMQIKVLNTIQYTNWIKVREGEPRIPKYGYLAVRVIIAGVWPPHWREGVTIEADFGRFSDCPELLFSL